MKPVNLTQSAKFFSKFLALHSRCGENCTTNLVFFNERIIKNIWDETEEAIATLERKDEDVC